MFILVPFRGRDRPGLAEFTETPIPHGQIVRMVPLVTSSKCYAPRWESRANVQLLLNPVPEYRGDLGTMV